MKYLSLLLVSVLLMGCMTTTNIGVYDPNVALDEQCTLQISGDLFVKEFDGQEVSWEKSKFANIMWGTSPDNLVIIDIPAGSHKFIVDYFYSASTTSTSSVSSTSTSSVSSTTLSVSRGANGLKAEYDFLPGYVYRMSANRTTSAVSVVIYGRGKK
ncbi:hypothetical protein AGMMS50268_07170 [Spirochaetia bacterium]|nr:hypothetical protein AGMMS50268_07170 [Spirochaetia bacterium]